VVEGRQQGWPIGQIGALAAQDQPLKPVPNATPTGTSSCGHNIQWLEFVCDGLFVMPDKISAVSNVG